MGEEAVTPLEAVTTAGPVLEPMGTVAWSWLALLTKKFEAGPLPKTTFWVPERPRPVKVTTVPGEPLVGVMSEIEGVTLKELSAGVVPRPAVPPLPSLLLTPMKPVVAVSGTVTWSSLSLLMVKTAPAPPTLTV